MLKSYLRDIRQGLEHLIFPRVCVSCSHLLGEFEFRLCKNCLKNGFERYDHNNDYIIKPNLVTHIYSLYEFDKGGRLQDVLHKFKYQFHKEIGYDFGRFLGKEFKDIWSDDFCSDETVVISVPLHTAKKRKRGYNQAFEIASGVSSALNLRLADDDSIIREKKTGTQTIFGLKNRAQNIKGAFKMNAKEQLEGKNIILVDDVFTTGATTFELAKLLESVHVGNINILTVARA